MANPTLQQLGERLRNRVPRPIVDVTNETTLDPVILGAGAFGRVNRATWQHATPADRFGGANNAVVKFIILNDAFELVNTEYKIMMLFHHELAMNRRIPPHPSILPLIGCYCGDNRTYGLVFPFVNQANTQRWLRNRDELGILPYTLRYNIVKDIARGLKHLHDSSIVHGDLYIGNIFIHDQSAIIADFGLSKISGISGISPPFSVLGMDDESLAKAKDVLMFGHTVRHIIRGTENAAGAETDCALMMAILNQCREDDPADRPSMNQVVTDIDALAIPAGP